MIISVNTYGKSWFIAFLLLSYFCVVTLEKREKAWLCWNSLMITQEFPLGTQLSKAAKHLPVAAQSRMRALRVYGQNKRV